MICKVCISLTAEYQLDSLAQVACGGSGERLGVCCQPRLIIILAEKILQKGATVYNGSGRSIQS